MHATVGRWPSVAAILRLMGLRYRAGNLLKFVVGAVAGGGAVAVYVPLGIAAILAVSVIAMLANRLADRVEDQIDYEGRGELFDVVGLGAVKATMAAMLPLYVTLVAAIVVLTDPRLSAVFLWCLMLPLGLSYSYGPRFKARKFGAPLLLAGNGPLFFWLGYGGTGGTLTTEVAAVLVLAFLVPATCSFAKDAPNLEGDAAIGYDSLYRRLAGRAGHTRLMLGIPHLLVAVLLLTGTVRPSFAAVLVVIPGAEILARAMTRARALEERRTVPEISLLYIMSMSIAMLFGFHPQLVTLAVGAGALAWYTLFTRYLHSESRLMSWSQVRVAARLITARDVSPRET